MGVGVAHTQSESAHARRRNAASAPPPPRATPARVCRTTASRVILTRARSPSPQTEWRHATEDLEVHGVKREGSRHPVPENPFRNHMSGQQYKQVTSS